MSTSFRRAAVATTAVAGLALAIPGLAGAVNVIPGDTDQGLTIMTAQPGVTVTVDAVDRVGGAVSGTFVNDSGMNLNCTSPNPNPQLRRGGTVTTAEVVRNSVDYYSIFQSDKAGAIVAGSSIPLMGRVGVDVQFWPLLQLLPTGSAASYLSNGVAESAEIGRAYTDAKMHGMAGDVNTFTVNNGATFAWNTKLSPAAMGERGQDPLGALFVCRVGSETGQHYAWAGFEAVDPVDPVDPSTGSLGSLTGSLGSSSAPEAETPAPDPEVVEEDEQTP